MKRSTIISLWISVLLLGVLLYFVLSKSDSETLLPSLGSTPKHPTCNPNFDSKDAPGSGKNMNRGSVAKFHRFVEILGFCPGVNSAFRTVLHNASVGGVSDSSHLYGYAFDINTKGLDQAMVIAAARQAGFNRIGIYANHIHIDDDPTKNTATW